MPFLCLPNANSYVPKGNVVHFGKFFLVNCFIYIGPIIFVVKVRYNVKMSLSDKKLNFLSFFFD